MDGPVHQDGTPTPYPYLTLCAKIVIILAKIQHTEEHMGLFSKKNQLELNVPDMNCGHCEAKVSDALSKLEGVSEVKADSKSKIAKLTLKGERTPSQDEISKALEGSGYSATIQK